MARVRARVRVRVTSPAPTQCTVHGGDGSGLKAKVRLAGASVGAAARAIARLPHEVLPVLYLVARGGRLRHLEVHLLPRPLDLVGLRLGRVAVDLEEAAARQGRAVAPLGWLTKLRADAALARAHLCSALFPKSPLVPTAGLVPPSVSLVAITGGARLRAATARGLLVEKPTRSPDALPAQARATTSQARAISRRNSCRGRQKRTGSQEILSHSACVISLRHFLSLL